MASFPDDPEDYRYHRIIFYDGDLSPKRKTIYLKKSSHYGKAGYTKTEAQDWKKRREIAFKDGEWNPWSERQAISKEEIVSLEEAIDKYLVRARRELAESTVSVRGRFLKAFKKAFGAQRPISQVKQDELAGWVNDNILKFKTKMKRREVVYALWRYAEDQGWAKAPKIEVLGSRAERKQARRPDKTWVTPDEYDKVKQAAAEIHRDRLQHPVGGSASSRKYREFEEEFNYIFDFLINTALRRSDFLNLSTAWFIRDCSMMRIGDQVYRPKSQEASEVIPLTHEARAIARRWIRRYGEDARPFSDITKSWMTCFFKDVFRKALPEKAGRLSLHKMRDSAAMYLLYEKGYTPQTVQQITRHEDLTTLNIYMHWAPEEGLKEIEKKA